MRKSLLLFLPILSAVMVSCLDDDSNNPYRDWKKQNDNWLVNFESDVTSGRKDYEKIVPDWAPQNSVYVKWHNDRSQTEKNLSPLSTSTVDITYALENIEGTSLGDSFSSTAYGDSIYRSQPHQNIAGMWIAMLNMHVGDSVTMVIPYLSAYGAQGRGSIDPYSTLIYHVKMKAVSRFEK